MKQVLFIKKAILILILFVLTGSITLEPVSAEGQSNFAISGRVTASVEDSDYLVEKNWVIKNISDGNRIGMPCSVKAVDGTAWLAIDFKAEQKVDRILIFPFSQCYPKDFEIQVKQNDKWVTVAERTNQVHPGNMRDIDGSTIQASEIKFEEKAASGVRIYVTKTGRDSNDDGWLQLREIETYYMGEKSSSEKTTVKNTGGETTQPTVLITVSENEPSNLKNGLIWGVACVIIILVISVTLFVIYLRKDQNK